VRAKAGDVKKDGSQVGVDIYYFSIFLSPAHKIIPELCAQVSKTPFRQRHKNYPAVILRETKETVAGVIFSGL